MAIRNLKIIQVDTIAEKDATPTNTRIGLLLCNENGYLYRKIPDGLGGTIWGIKSTMSTSVYDANLNGIVDDSEKLGGELPDFYATQNDLDSKADLVDGLVPTSQLPPMSTGDALGDFASQAAMLAVTQTVNGDPVSPGDFGIRTDTNKFCVLSKLPASTLANWGFIQLPSGVVTINDLSGANIVLGKNDIGLGNVDNTSDANKPVSGLQSTAIANAQSAAQSYTDNAFSDLSTTIVPEGVNLYYRDDRVDARLAGKTTAAFGDSTDRRYVTDAQRANIGNLASAAFQDTSAFATAAQGAKADTAYQSGTAIPESQITNLVSDLAAINTSLAAKASSAAINLQNSSVPTWQRLFTGQFLTTDGTLTPVFTSAVIPDGTSVWVDCTIHGQYSSGQGQAVLSMQGVIQKTAGSNIRMAQAVRLQTTGDLGLAIATCSVTLNTSLQKFIVNIQGKAATSIKWSGKIEINQFTMV